MGGTRKCQHGAGSEAPLPHAAASAKPRAEGWGCIPCVSSLIIGSTMGDAVRNLRLGTRGSLLAKTQSQLVATELEKRGPGLQGEVIVLKPTADGIIDKPLYELGGKGLFVKELEQALLDDKVDMAVHSF